MKPNLKLNKYIISEILTVPAGTFLGLDEKQISRRSHLCKIIEDAEDGPDGYRLVEITRKTQFKRGEIVFAETFPKTVAAVLVDSMDQDQDTESAESDSSDEVENDDKNDQDANSATDESEFDNMDIDQARAACEARDISFHARNKLPTLIERLKAAE